jgi:hypothetical protein
MLNISQDDFHFVKDKIYRSNNIIRFLIFQDEIKSQAADKFISSIRKDHAIYVDYASQWYELLEQNASLETPVNSTPQNITPNEIFITPIESIKK